MAWIPVDKIARSLCGSHFGYELYATPKPDVCVATGNALVCGSSFADKLSPALRFRVARRIALMRERLGPIDAIDDDELALFFAACARVAELPMPPVLATLPPARVEERAKALGKPLARKERKALQAIGARMATLPPPGEWRQRRPRRRGARGARRRWRSGGRVRRAVGAQLSKDRAGAVADDVRRVGRLPRAPPRHGAEGLMAEERKGKRRATSSTIGRRPSTSGTPTWRCRRRARARRRRGQARRDRRRDGGRDAAPDAPRVRERSATPAVGVPELRRRDPSVPIDVPAPLDAAPLPEPAPEEDPLMHLFDGEMELPEEAGQALGTLLGDAVKPPPDGAPPPTSRWASSISTPSCAEPGLYADDYGGSTRVAAADEFDQLLADTAAIADTGSAPDSRRPSRQSPAPKDDEASSSIPSIDIDSDPGFGAESTRVALVGEVEVSCSPTPTTSRRICRRRRRRRACFKAPTLPEPGSKLPSGRFKTPSGRHPDAVGKVARADALAEDVAACDAAAAEEAGRAAAARTTSRSRWSSAPPSSRR